MCINCIKWFILWLCLIKNGKEDYPTPKYNKKLKTDQDKMWENEDWVNNIEYSIIIWKKMSCEDFRFLHQCTYEIIKHYLQLMKSQETQRVDFSNSWILCAWTISQVYIIVYKCSRSNYHVLIEIESLLYLCSIYFLTFNCVTLFNVNKLILHICVHSPFLRL